MVGPAVGSGAEGILYRGSITTAAVVTLDVAIKMLQPKFLSRVDEWHTRWTEQVELLRSLQVPGVVPVRDGFLGPLPHPPGQAGDGRTLYLVMNWVEGESLDEWIRHRPDRNPIDDLKVLVPVAAALDLMHSGRATGGVPVVHRDIKPSNILVTENGSVLVDFGLTRGLPDGQRLTGVVGTPGYLAPESAAAGSYSSASDRYAFGAVAYFVLTGFEPPTSHQPEALRTLLGAVRELDERPEISDQVMAMLATDPDERPTGLANWVGQLRRSSLEAGPDILNPSAPRRHPAVPDDKNHPKKRGAHRSPRRVAFLLVGALVALVATTLVFAADLTGSTGLNPANHTPTLSTHSPGAIDPSCSGVELFDPGLAGSQLVPGALASTPSRTVVGAGEITASYLSSPGVNHLVGIDSVCRSFLDKPLGPGGSPSIHTAQLGDVTLTALAIGPNGGIYAAGSDAAGWVVVRYLKNGSVDTSFGHNGYVSNPVSSSTASDPYPSGAATAIAVTSKGEVFVFGHDNGADCCSTSILLALQSSGRPEANFGHDGIVTTDLPPATAGDEMEVTPDGKLLLASNGIYTGGCGGFTIERYQPSGLPDASFPIFRVAPHLRRLVPRGSPALPGITLLRSLPSSSFRAAIPLHLAWPPIAIRRTRKARRIRRPLCSWPGIMQTDRRTKASAMAESLY